MPARVKRIPYDLSALETVTLESGLPRMQDEASELTAGLSTEQLIAMATGDPAKGQGSALGSAGVSVPGSAGETSSCAIEQGIANIVLADGPAGLRLNQKYYVRNGKAALLPFEASVEHGLFYEGTGNEGQPRYQFCTAIPVGTLLAQSWDEALLEIYLRGFEIAIAESHPYAMMTSYNLLNGIHTANSYDLCTRIAREEFGFDGFIMTDWTTTEQGDDCTAAGCILAGNDMVMPGQYSDHESIRQALQSGVLSEERLRACIERIVRVILKSDRYEKTRQTQKLEQLRY